MHKRLVWRVVAAMVAGTMLLPATALATPGMQRFAEVSAAGAKSGGVGAAGVQAAAFNGIMTSLTNTAWLPAEDMAFYGVWIFPGQTVNAQLTSSADFYLNLETEEDELISADEDWFGPGTESYSYTNNDYAGGPLYAWIGVLAFEPGSYTLRVSMNDAPVAPELVRIAGPDRYTTSVKASEDAFASGADTVVIATGTNFADALAAAGLCGVYDAPLLLVPTGSLPTAVSSEIDRLGATEAIIVGGTGAVSSAVQTALGAKPALAGNVSRIAGTNRYDTSKRVAEAMSLELGADLPEAIVVNGANFADALSASPLAYAGGRPILLTPTASAHEALIGALDSVGVQNVTIVGGTGAVSAAAEQQIESALGTQADRVFGSTRFETAAAVAQYADNHDLLSREFIGYAHGFGFADGLAGGVSAGRNGGVLLLTESYVEPSVTQSFNVTSVGITTSARVFGGSGVVWGNVLGMISGDLF